MGQPEKTDMGRGFKALLVLACAAIVGYGIRFWQPVLVPLLLGLCVAAACQPVFDAVRRRGLPTYVAVTIAMVAVVGAVGSFAALVTVAGGELADSLPKYERALRTFQVDTAIFLQQHRLSSMSLAVARINPGARSAEVMGGMFWPAATVAGTAALVLVLAGFFMLERAVLHQKLARLPALGNASAMAHRALGDVQQYLWLKTWISAATGLCVGVLCAALGVSNPVFWGLLAFAFNYIPNIGSLVAAIPAIGLTLILRGPALAGALAAGYTIINLIVGNIIEPRVMGRRLGLSPLVVVVAMVAWGWLLGPVGALLSTPLTMVFKITLSHTDDFAWLARLLGDRREPLVAEPIADPAPERHSALHSRRSWVGS